MSDPATLRPATPEEIAQSISHALCFDGRRRVHQADLLMAKIAAEQVVEHLQRCGYVLMKQPDAAAPTTSHHMKPDR